jgi:hypothetical protein
MKVIYVHTIEQVHSHNNSAVGCPAAPSQSCSDLPKAVRKIPAVGSPQPDARPKTLRTPPIEK